MKIKNILPGMRNFEVLLKITKKYEPRDFDKGDRKGSVANAFAADETGQTRVVFWNDYVDKLKDFNEGDLVIVRDGYIKDNQGRKEIHLNNNSELTVNPEGETMGEIATASQEVTRKKLKELKGDEFNVEVLGTIVQLFEPRFYEVCPSCGKRTRMQESERYVCEEHGQIEPKYSYVLNAVLDDGTESMRIVAFREQAAQLISKTAEEMQ